MYPAITSLVFIMAPLDNDDHSKTDNDSKSSSNKINGGHLFCAIGSPTTIITDSELQSHINSFLSFVGGVDRKHGEILVIPPDYTRYHSHAGEITRLVAEYYNFIPRRGRTANDSSSTTNSNNKIDDDDVISAAPTTNEPSPPTTTSPSAVASPPPAGGGGGILQIMPALGTHLPMSSRQIKKMFGVELASLSPSPFVIHDWRNDVVTIGHVPCDMVSSATHGLVNDTEWPAQLNKLVWEKRISNRNSSNNNNNNNTDMMSSPPPPPLILSIGQVVPHEVLGMANYNKNLFVGVGGVEAINLSHFIGAVHGMEKLMGRGHNPLRSILNYASEKYIENKFDLWYILTVMGTDYGNATAANPGGEVVMRGLYIGNTVQCYDEACELSLRVNFNLLSHAPQRMVVYLNEEYQSTWLGNKAIYRTRMAIADGGELIIIAPHVEIFGEDKQIDALIRQVGYIGTPAIMNEMAKEDSNMKNNLSAVAHLIHGSSEGRFTIVYCPGKLSRSEIESVGFKYGEYHDMIRRYDITTLKDGWNTEINVDDGRTVEEYYYISNPALGLWAVASRFEEEDAKDVAVVSSNKQDEEDGECSSTTNIISDKQQAVDMSGGVGGWKNPPPH